MYCLSFAVSPDQTDEIFEIVEAQLASLASTCESMLELRHGKKVLELRPQVDWNKGSAVLWILEALGLGQHRDRIFPIYLGDDITDEDAFLALKQHYTSDSSASILVREEDETERPAETHASFVLRSPMEVEVFLDMLVNDSQSGSPHGSPHGSPVAPDPQSHTHSQSQTQTSFSHPTSTNTSTSNVNVTVTGTGNLQSTTPIPVASDATIVPTTSTGMSMGRNMNVNVMSPSPPLSPSSAASPLSVVMAPMAPVAPSPTGPAPSVGGEGSGFEPAAPAPALTTVETAASVDPGGAAVCPPGSFSLPQSPQGSQAECWQRNAEC